MNGPTTYQEHLAEIRSISDLPDTAVLELHMMAIATVDRVWFQCIGCAHIVNSLRTLRLALVGQKYDRYRRQMMYWRDVVRQHLDRYVENATNIVNVTTADGPAYHWNREYEDWLQELMDVICDAEDWGR